MSGSARPFAPRGARQELPLSGVLPQSPTP
jgi:hypothetical protein